MIDILHYSFFQNALLGALLASIVCGIVGTYIVTRRLVFISGGITHASFGGIGLGVLMGINPILSAMIFAVLSAFGVEWMARKGDVREDSAIAVLDFRHECGHHLLLLDAWFHARSAFIPLWKYSDDREFRSLVVSCAVRYCCYLHDILLQGDT